MSQYIVGITGGIGSGKSTVANGFAELGVDIVDADVVAREVVKPGSACLTAISEHFGQQILLPDGNLNRSQLRQQIFSDPIAKQWLNDLMHPAIRQLMLAQLAQAQSPYCLLVAPLLFENGLEQYVNRCLVVDVSEAVQLARTSKRDTVDRQQVQNIMQAQISRIKRLEKADDVINNEPPWVEVKMHIPKLHENYLALAKNCVL